MDAGAGGTGGAGRTNGGPVGGEGRTRGGARPAGRGGGAGGRRLAGLSLLLGGGALVVLGLMVVVTGTGLSGALGMRVETFGRIDCRDTRTQKGQTVRHCFGESPAQQRANRAELKQVDLEMLRAHLDGVPRSSYGPGSSSRTTTGGRTRTPSPRPRCSTAGGGTPTPRRSSATA
ncbi:hypothetical protein [Streptomyces californicus]|uniref:hypothetical protein n=1 Tax=Streptomyces californicus TaxID=67351 RepID=UPI000AC21CC1|nr:hypothetical protein [Streptomyces californicus]